MFNILHLPNIYTYGLILQDLSTRMNMIVGNALLSYVYGNMNLSMSYLTLFFFFREEVQM
jgi:hypothetical protein